MYTKRALIAIVSESTMFFFWNHHFWYGDENIIQLVLKFPEEPTLKQCLSWVSNWDQVSHKERTRGPRAA